MYVSNLGTTSILFINVVSRATLTNIDSKGIFKNSHTNMASACILAITGRNGVPTYGKRKKKKKL